MRWRRVDSPDVIDQRGRSGARSGGLPIPLGRAGGGLGLLGVIVVLAIQLLGGGSGGARVRRPDGVRRRRPPRRRAGDPGLAGPRPRPARLQRLRLHERTADLGEDVPPRRAALRAREARPLQRRRDTGCGSASSAVGPFYCPADQRVYLDLSFYREMDRSLQAGGDFAWAYVIAHEVGHHVQRLTGTSEEVRRLQQRGPGRGQPLSVRLELQADCYAGVWASTVFRAGDLQDGDLDEAFTASEAVGDDRLQRRAGGSIDPDSFTHGTSAQRKHWFRTGYQAAAPEACDTFQSDQV